MQLRIVMGRAAGLTGHPLWREHGDFCGPDPAPIASGAPLRLLLADSPHGALIQPVRANHVRDIISDLSAPAQMTGVVDVVVRQRSGRWYGDNTQARAVRDLLRRGGVDQVRSALLFGCGNCTRAAIGALGTMGCTRYVMGYLSRRRQVELAGQLRQIRKQASYFPLTEMGEFMRWAELTGYFRPGDEPPLEDGGAERDRDKNTRKWDLLVLGVPERAVNQLVPAIAGVNFLHTVGRVLDLSQAAEGGVVRQARELGIPSYTRAGLAELRLKAALDLFRRAAESDLEVAPRRRKPRPYVLRRHPRSS